MTICSEVARELRWLLYSRVLLCAVVVGAVFGAWGVQSSIVHLEMVTEQYEALLQEIIAAGGTLEDALSEPVIVTSGPEGTEIIDNSLRYRFEEVQAAAAVLTPAGLSVNTLSVSCVLLLPFAGFAAGISIASHDRRGGGVVLRWPQSSVPRLVTAKVAALLVLVLVLVVLTAVSAMGLGWLRPASAAVTQALSLISVFAVAVFSVAIGVAFGALGLCVGSLYSGRAIPVLSFFAFMYLLPLQGAYDPRVWITVSGQEVLRYSGSLRLPMVGDSFSAGLGVAGIAISSLVGLYLAWQYRSRMPDKSIG